MPRFDFALNAAIVSLLGIVFFFAAIYAFAIHGMYVLAFSLLLTATGCSCCGLTDGLLLARRRDYDPRGWAFSRSRRGAAYFGILGLPDDLIRK